MRRAPAGISSTRAARAAAALAFVVVLFLPILACDKLKALGGKADGGESSGSGSGGGILSFLSSDFEGEITMLLTQKAKKTAVPQQIAFDIKKPKYRLDFTGMTDNAQLAGGGSMILDPPAKKGYLLIPAQKTAMVIDFEKMKNMPKGQTVPGLGGKPTPPGTPPPPPKIEKTGKKDTVAGYTCDIWNVTSDNKKAELCMAEGITWIDISDLGWSSPEVAALAAISDLNHFPLRVISYDVKGVEETRMEATKIEKKKLDDSRFVVPPDYKVVDIAAMMGGLMGAPGAASGMPPNFPRPHGGR